MLWNLPEVAGLQAWRSLYGSAPENWPATSKDRESLTVQRIRGVVRLGAKRTSGALSPGGGFGRLGQGKSVRKRSFVSDALGFLV